MFLVQVSSENTSPQKLSLWSHATIVKRQFQYQPGTLYCGTGDSCAEACGPSFEQCGSGDASLYCYDPSAGQTCCDDGTGSACDPGFYCAMTPTGMSVCCPNEGMDFDSCAAVYSLGAIAVPQTVISTAESVKTVTANVTVVITTTITSAVQPPYCTFGWNSTTAGVTATSLPWNPNGTNPTVSFYTSGSSYPKLSISLFLALSLLFCVIG
ncbi:hypothetical protein K458DRAFT_471536 [Lentithecium fluviatile CBS 122367]|uniref:Uncharacterized protein n=1 Tax=Lentithecium fluviatile CBS 122367 TaxID=1168545 RepID=A0A6G1J7D1_9PLEO|nr:hypothetical protein K458DRAFT_471536 [Lentithecium fluviatile CBS 122367]